MPAGGVTVAAASVTRHNDGQQQGHGAEGGSCALGAGAPLTGDAWVARLRTPLEQAVAEEKAGYERGLAAGPKYPVCSGWQRVLLHLDT